MSWFGDVATVWTPAAFITAILFGFGFGYMVVASISAQEKWHTGNRPAIYGWIVGVTCAWFLAGLTLAQVLAALVDGDYGWVRIVSRVGPYMACSIGVGLGTWRGLVRAGKR